MAEKMSETLLEFVAPLIDAWGQPPNRKQVEALIKISWLAWNAVVYAERGNRKYLEEVRARNARTGNRQHELLFDDLVQRKRALFGDDHRLFGDWSLVADGEGGHRLHVSGYAPPAITKTPEA